MPPLNAEYSRPEGGGMSLLYLILIYLFFAAFLFTVTYYADLISSKEQYTREEISNILPFITESWQKLSDKYPMPGLTLALFFPSFLGLLIPFISASWFFNSSILFVVLYVVLPVMKERFESVRVSASEYYADAISNFISKYARIVLIGFGTATGASLMYNWAHKKELGFIWFIFNLAVIVVLEVLTISREIKE